MSDPLDDLRAALGSVEPSVGFEQRTLRHVATGRAARAGKSSWMMLVTSAGAAAAILIAVVALPPRAARIGQSAVREPAVPAPVAVVAPSAPVIHPGPGASRGARPVRAAAILPVIPESAHIDQAIAVRRLMLSATMGKVIGSPDANQLTDDGSIRMPALIEIKPIVIAPLPNGQGGGSER